MIIIFLLLISSFGLTLSSLKSYEGYKLLRFLPQTERQLELLSNLIPDAEDPGLSFWSEPRAVGEPVDVLVSPSKFEAVAHFSKEHNFDEPKVLITDVQKLMMSDEEKPRSSLRQGGGTISLLNPNEFFNAFRRLSLIYSFLDRLEEMYPNLVSSESIGQTSEGREMRILKITSSSNRQGRQANGTKPIFWIDAGIHAREWAAPPTALFLAYALASQYDKTPDVRRMVDAFEWQILPVANPDGYEYTHTADRFWRKTRSRNNFSSCRGTDPNRNFGFHWKENGASNNPCAETYAGQKAFSEPETMNIASHLWRYRQRIQVYLSFHSYSQLWLTPWGYTSDLPADYDDLYNKARRAADAVEKVYGTRYKVGSSTRVLYAAAGGSDDWAKGVAGIPYAYTVELRPSGNAFRGFVLNPLEIKPCGLEMLAGIVQLAKDLRNSSQTIETRLRKARSRPARI